MSVGPKRASRVCSGTAPEGRAQRRHREGGLSQRAADGSSSGMAGACNAYPAISLSAPGICGVRRRPGQHAVAAWSTGPPARTPNRRGKRPCARAGEHAVTAVAGPCGSPFPSSFFSVFFYKTDFLSFFLREKWRHVRSAGHAQGQSCCPPSFFFLVFLPLFIFSSP